MYKLFLCLRYLRRRYIALVAIVGIALCVFMVVIVASVMNGFLGGVEDAARGMMGDVIVDGRGGLPFYDEFLDELRALPEVEAAAPVIYTAGLLRLGPKYTQMVRVVGLDLPEAVKVTTFGESLYPDAMQGVTAFRTPPEAEKRLLAANSFAAEQVRRGQEEIERAEDRLAEEEDKPEDQRNQDLIEQLAAGIEDSRLSLAGFRRRFVYDPNHPGLILGVDLPGTTRRDAATGEYTRILQVGAGEKAQLTLLPIGRGGVGMMTEPVKKTFNIIADQRFGVYLIDSNHVYADFSVLQNLIEMDGRCDQIQIKIRGGDDRNVLAAGVAAVRATWRAFADKRIDLAAERAIIQTWREKQAPYIEPIERQRTLVIIMFGVVSLVAVVLVFAIFYMLVVQKIKDIGILKSIGASDAGVACVFLLYGGAVGLVGSILGAIGGWQFVIHINAIHDWIADAFGYRVFTREAYMFDLIPDKIDPMVIVGVIVGAMLAGLFGALLPAARAARMQPVEALRYE